MEDNVILTREEFMELIKIKVRVEVVEEFANHHYASPDEIYAMLGIEVTKNG